MSIIEKLRSRLRAWLGITDLSVDVRGVVNRLFSSEEALREIRKLLDAEALADWGYKDNTVIVLATRVGGGHVRVLDIHLRDMNEMRELVRKLEGTYQPRWFDDRVGPVSGYDWEGFLGNQRKDWK